MYECNFGSFAFGFIEADFFTSIPQHFLYQEDLCTSALLPIRRFRLAREVRLPLPGARREVREALPRRGRWSPRGPAAKIGSGTVRRRNAMWKVDGGCNF